MTTPDLNLLVTLDVLLAEGSVARAARRLHLSPSAMSRTLARLRETTGDPLLVRAGRDLVQTPRALEIRDRVTQIVQDGRKVLRPAEKLELNKLERTFRLRSSEGFVENFGPDLIARVTSEAPWVQVHFMQKADKDSALLRNGTIDFETGVVVSTTAPEFKTQALFRDSLIGVVRPDHPLSRCSVDLMHYLNAQHIRVSRRGLEKRSNEDEEGPLDEALKFAGHERRVTAIVGGFSAAVALARETGLVATVPERHTGKLREGMHCFALPFLIPEFTVSLLWHPRQDADPAHRWMRRNIREVCGKEHRS